MGLASSHPRPCQCNLSISNIGFALQQSPLVLWVGEDEETPLPHSLNRATNWHMACFRSCTAGVPFPSACKLGFQVQVVEIIPSIFNQQAVYYHNVFCDPSIARADLLPPICWLHWAVTARGREVFPSDPGSSASPAIMHVFCMLMFVTLYHKPCNICSA